MNSVIEIRDLVKRYGGTWAVNKLNLSVPSGSIFALLGDNGAGKSTTIRMLTGLLKPDSGRATILGLDSFRDAVKLRQRVGYVPERPRFYDWMSVAEIGWFSGGFYGANFRTRYTELLKRYQLDGKAKLRHLSKGQYAKVALSLALASDPEVLILDEPTSGLDLLVRREFLASLVALAGEGRTVVICSHQIAEVERIASHVAFMAGGKLLLTNTLDELRRRIVRLRLRFEESPPSAEHLGTVLHRNGVGKQWQAVLLDPQTEALTALRHSQGVHDVEESPLDLEEVYCALLSRSAS
jgi:ABC-2 type transport system ATP-binding protein